MNEIVRIPFHGTYIHTVKVGDDPRVVIRPTIEGMGLDYSAQLKKLKTRSWATVAETATVAEDGKVRDMSTVDLETWAMLLANIDENRVAGHAKQLVIFYQKESGRVLKEFWTTGEVAPRAPRPRQPISYGAAFLQPEVYTYDETCALMRQHCGIDLTVNELTRYLRAGGVLKQNGSPTKTYRHHLHFTGSAWNVVAHMFPQIVYRVCEVGRNLQDFRFIQMRLELDGVGRPPEIEHERRSISD